MFERAMPTMDFNCTACALKVDSLRGDRVSTLSSLPTCKFSLSISDCNWKTWSMLIHYTIISKYQMIYTQSSSFEHDPQSKPLLATIDGFLGWRLVWREDNLWIPCNSELKVTGCDRIPHPHIEYPVLITSLAAGQTGGEAAFIVPGSTNPD